MRIAIDAMGGDFAPAEILKGARQALAADPQLELLLVGQPAAICASWPEAPQTARVQIVPASQVIGMGEAPALACRRKKDASINVATRLVKNGQADAVLSAGSTGAQMVAALFELGRIKGVSRPAIGTFIPTLQGPRFLLDIGANTDTAPENLLQFAWLGRIYLQQALNIADPGVWLLSNGAEAQKGDERTRRAYQLLAASAGLNFRGSVEGRDLLEGRAEVIVTDGFAGNVALKTMEGTGEALFSLMRQGFAANTRSRLGALLLRPVLRELKKKLDYAEYGGAPLLGVQGLSIVCHGSSRARAIESAVAMAAACASSGLLNKLKEHDFSLPKAPEETPKEP